MRIFFIDYNNKYTDEGFYESEGCNLTYHSWNFFGLALNFPQIKYIRYKYSRWWFPLSYWLFKYDGQPTYHIRILWFIDIYWGYSGEWL